MSGASTIPIGAVGEIVSGEMQGWFVKVEETPEGGAYLILQSNGPFGTAKEGYDDWVLAEDLDYYSQVKGWDVRWA